MSGGALSTIQCSGDPNWARPGLYFNGAEKPRIWVTSQINLLAYHPEFVG